MCRRATRRVGRRCRQMVRRRHRPGWEAVQVQPVGQLLELGQRSSVVILLLWLLLLLRLLLAVVRLRLLLPSRSLIVVAPVVILAL